MSSIRIGPLAANSSTMGSAVSILTLLAPTRDAQMPARWDLPDPVGPASITTGDGQSGQRSTIATAALKRSETIRSSRPEAES